jgi:Flp pilus assembly pilin Flp
MKMITKTLKNLWKDESAQGATEYILLLMIVVAVVMLFKDRIKSAVTGRLDALDSGLGGVSSNF